MRLLTDIFWALWIFAVALILVYGLVIFFGAPYLPTLRFERQRALDLLNLQPGQLFIDLGSGDGAMLVMAAERGLHAVGYEINPFLWGFSWLRTRRYGGRVKVKLVSFWRADLSQADGVFVFLITHRMKQLDRLLSVRRSKKKLKVVSNSFKIPGRKIRKSSGPMFLYEY